MGFFFNGVVAAVAVLAGASTNLCNEADFLGNGELLVNSGVREEYTDLSVLEPRVALFDFSEDVRAVGAVDDDDVFGAFDGVFGGGQNDGLVVVGHLTLGLGVCTGDAHKKKKHQQHLT